ncbi:hypothetical protein, partial [Enterovibrio nigricans]|uniref:hypothetical protein n=1 Tax=Enterovibrio nigricans TaxID=504469 RepID=UPI001BB029C2
SNLFPTLVPFGHSVLTTTSADPRITHLTWIHLRSSYRHPSTYPICGYQEERPLTIPFPSHDLLDFVTLSDPLLYSGS